MSDFLSILIEEGCSNAMIEQCLLHEGYSREEATMLIHAAGIGKKREKLKSWARERYKLMRK